MKQTAKAPTNGTVTKKNLPAQPLSTPVQTNSGLLELFIDSVKDMYWSENHLVKSIPKMINAAGSSALKQALSTHLELTVKQAVRLENIFELLGVKIQAKKCDALDGLVMSGEHVIENTVAGSEARDMGIILSALKVENFEAACYNGLIELATIVGHVEVVDLLQQNLTEELEANQQLTAISQKNNNTQKASPKIISKK